ENLHLQRLQGAPQMESFSSRPRAISAVSAPPLESARATNRTRVERKRRRENGDGHLRSITPWGYRYLYRTLPRGPRTAHSRSFFCWRGLLIRSYLFKQFKSSMFWGLFGLPTLRWPRLFPGTGR